MNEQTGAGLDGELEMVASGALGAAFVIVGQLTRLADAALADWGLTTRQWLLLAVLGRAFPDRAASLSEAAAAYGSSRQNVKQIALGLESRGFLRLVQDERDARTTRLVPTDRVRIFDEPEGRARGRRLLEAAFAGLDPDEIRALDDLLVRWVRQLARSAPHPDGAGTALAEPTPSRKG